MRSFSCIAIGCLFLSIFGALPAFSQELSTEDVTVAILKQMYNEDSQADRPYRSFTQTASEKLFQFHPSNAYPENWKQVEDWILDQLPPDTSPNPPEPRDKSVKVLWLSVCGSRGTWLRLDDEFTSSDKSASFRVALFDRARLEVAFEANKIPISLLSDFSRWSGSKADPEPQIRKLNERLETWRRSTGSRDRWLVLEPWCVLAAKPDLSRLPSPFQHMPEGPFLWSEEFGYPSHTNPSEGASDVNPPDGARYGNFYSVQYFFLPQPSVAPTRIYVASRWEARDCDARKKSKTNISCPVWKEAVPGSAIEVTKPGWVRCVSVDGAMRSWGDTRITARDVFTARGEQPPPIKLNCTQP